MSRKTMILLALPLMIAACERAPTAPVGSNVADAATPHVNAANSSALVRTTWPSDDDPGPPFYARIDGVPPHILIVDGWAVIFFYRDPTCIPADFNLLEFFHAPAAFGCALAVEGFSLWKSEPFLGAPKIVQTQGTGAVPFWFIPAGVVLDAMQDAVLTIGELAGLEGRLVGAATHFSEVLHPSPLPPFLGGGGHPKPKLIVNAQGSLLEDGRRFQFHLTRVDPEVRSARLRMW